MLQTERNAKIYQSTNADETQYTEDGPHIYLVMLVQASQSLFCPFRSRRISWLLMLIKTRVWQLGKEAMSQSC